MMLVVVVVGSGRVGSEAPDRVMFLLADQKGFFPGLESFLRFGTVAFWTWTYFRF